MNSGWIGHPRRAAALSVASNTVLVVLKISVGVLGGSVAVLSEGLHSAIDLVASLIAFVSVSLSARPADKNHPYGHGKIENVSGTVEALLIIAAGAFVVHEAVGRLSSRPEITHLDAGIGLMVVSATVNAAVSRLLFRVARRHESPALEADAHHLSVDVYTSLGVLAGLTLVRFTGFLWLDSVVAVGVALLIFYIGFRVLKSSFLDLLDQSLPEEEQAKIQQIIDRHGGRFIEYHKLRTRKSGPTRYIDLHLVISEDEAIKDAHDFCHHIEQEIRDELGNASVTIHLEPGGSGPKSQGSPPVPAP
ncbi:MAG: cation diffusion facilitator family transporter [bacterium]